MVRRLRWLRATRCTEGTSGRGGDVLDRLRRGRQPAAAEQDRTLRAVREGTRRRRGRGDQDRETHRLYGNFASKYEKITLKFESVLTKQQLTADTLSKTLAVQKRAERLLKELEANGKIADEYPHYREGSNLGAGRSGVARVARRRGGRRLPLPPEEGHSHEPLALGDGLRERRDGVHSECPCAQGRRVRSGFVADLLRDAGEVEPDHRGRDCREGEGTHGEGDGDSQASGAAFAEGGARDPSSCPPN